MRVWRAIDAVPADLTPSVVTVGNFDGVHRGHRHVVGTARATADRLGLDQVVVVTFDPHPFAVLRPEHAPVMLCDLDTRLRRLEAAGADAALVVPFSLAIAAWTPQEFIDRVLVGALHASAIVVGGNFRFGNRAAGDVTTLREAGAVQGFEVVAVALDGGPQVWSSTYVRACLAAGDVSGAAEALGRPVAVRGPVVEGDRRGRELGFPTANVAVSGTAVPGDGVYAGWLVRADGSRLPSAISVGTNPTFEGERERRVEAYVLDRDDLELYGETIEVEFVERLRGMQRFDGAEQLLEAIAEDVRRTREILAR